jgi:hypothetical protein
VSKQDPNKLYELVNLEVDEGSPVDKGDNPGAKIVLVKNAPGGDGVFARLKGVWDRFVRKDYGSEMEASLPRTTSQIMAANQFMQDFCTLKMAFIQSIRSIMESAPAESMGPLLKKSVEEFSAGAADLAKAAGITKSAELDAILKDMQDTAAVAEKRDSFASAVEKLGAYGEPHNSPVPDQGGGTTDKEQGMEKAAITFEAALKGISDPAVKAAIEAELAKAKQPVAAPVIAAAAPTLSDEVTKRLEKAEKDAAEAKAQVAKLEAERLDGEFLAKAKSFQVPGMDHASVAKTLKDAYGVSADAGKSMEQAYAALTAQVKQSNAIFKSIGRAGIPPNGGSDASPHLQLVAKAAEIQKVDPKMTKEQAYRTAAQQNPGLYRAAINNEPAAS